MRRLFTTADGSTESALRWGVRSGSWVRVERGVYAEGPEPPSALDRARARVLASGTPARGCLAGVLHDLDGVALDDRPTRRRRRDIVLDDFDGLPPQRAETARIRRVLGRRPPNAPPTESLLETLAVQLARTIPGLPEPTRQLVVTRDGVFVARVDLAWPELGLFVELDGQHHRGQPVYDARRETAVVAATGWLCARFTWHEIVVIPRATARRLADIVDQCRRLRTA